MSELKEGNCTGKINSKDKGKRIELLVSNWLKDRGCLSARRSQQYNGIAGTSDVLADELPNVHIECKGTTSPTIPRCLLTKENTKKPGWILQVVRDCPKDRSWVIFFKANNHDLITIIDTNEFKLIADGNISPIAVAGDSFSPGLELTKANKIMSTIKNFNIAMGYAYEDSTPIVVYEVLEGFNIVAVEADVWLNWKLNAKCRLHRTT